MIVPNSHLVLPPNKNQLVVEDSHCKPASRATGQLLPKWFQALLGVTHEDSVVLQIVFATYVDDSIKDHCLLVHYTARGTGVEVLPVEVGGRLMGERGSRGEGRDQIVASEMVLLSQPITQALAQLPVTYSVKSRRGSGEFYHISMMPLKPKLSTLN